MKSLVHSFKDLLFSRKCPICNKETNGTYYICDNCYSSLRKKGTIKNIKNYYYLYFYDKDIKRVIADYKLNNRKNLALELKTLIDKKLKLLIEELDIDKIIPVPVSKKRLLERGFNQVEEILDRCHIKYDKTYRIRDTEHMYKYQEYEKRKHNIAGVFDVSGLDLNGKNIMIVDDIVTTGSTTKEICKEINKKYRPKEIYIFSIAMSKGFKG